MIGDSMEGHVQRVNLVMLLV